jgi:hypothetical protein
MLRFSTPKNDSCGNIQLCRRGPNFRIWWGRWPIRWIIMTSSPRGLVASSKAKASATCLSSSIRPCTRSPSAFKHDRPGYVELVPQLNTGCCTIVEGKGFPTWRIGPGDTDIEISETLRDLLGSEIEHKFLVDGNTHKFVTNKWGIEMLSNFFWYPHRTYTRTTLLIMVECETQDDFHYPLTTARYLSDVRYGKVMYDTHTRKRLVLSDPVNKR